jgi:hypothetical protein
MTFILHTTGPVKVGTTVIGGVRNLGANLGSQIKGEPSSGEIYARILALYGQKPTVQFTTEDLQDALTACGPLGVSLASSNLTLYGSKLLAGGSIDPASAHISLACALGLLHPVGLTCAHQGDATIDYRAMLYNATDAADPFVLTNTASLPTIALFKKWTLGTVELGGITIAQNMNVHVDFGIRCFGEAADSNIRDEIVSIQSIEPKITVSSSNNGLIAALLGASGAFSIVLRDRVPGGTFGTATITLAATSGLVMQETAFQAQGHRPGEISLQGHIYWDGSTSPVTYTYGAGI